LLDAQKRKRTGEELVRQFHAPQAVRDTLARYQA
jgi:hypothetical protein